MSVSRMNFDIVMERDDIDFIREKLRLKTKSDLLIAAFGILRCVVEDPEVAERYILRIPCLGNVIAGA